MKKGFLRLGGDFHINVLFADIASSHLDTILFFHFDSVIHLIHIYLDTYTH